MLNISTVVATACAVIITATVVRERWVQHGSRLAPARPSLERVNRWREYAGVGRRRGSDSAAVTITEFADFQCSYCRELAAHLEAMRAKYGDQLAIVSRHAPLPSHRLARYAAVASECAAVQGHFWEYHDLLFAMQDSLGIVPWDDLAIRAGARDTIAFRRCASDGKVLGPMREDSMAAEALRLDGTPLVLVNDVLVRGSPGPERLDALISAALHRVIEARPHQ